MRFRHLFSETFSGLRQNLTMTLAVVMTMWVSLSLFGAGLLASQQVDLMKGRWYDKIEISVFLCTADTRGDQCEPSVERRRQLRLARPRAVVIAEDLQRGQGDLAVELADLHRVEALDLQCAEGHVAAGGGELRVEIAPLGHRDARLEIGEDLSGLQALSR